MSDRELELNIKFDHFNTEYFGGKLPKIPVVANGRLKTAAGLIRGVYTSRTNYLGMNYKQLVPKRIDIHQRLFDDVGWDTPADKPFRHSHFEITLLHEMTHAYLWIFFNEKNHSPRFHSVMSGITGVYTDTRGRKKRHTYHSLDVSKWRRPRNRKVSGKQSPGFNPFSL